jgi:methylated-DNA-[protein]-cysteine S-methyltransferase
MATKPPFAAIVEVQGATVLRVCRAVLGADDADDAWSETFLSAMKAYPSLPDDANVEAWLVTIAHRRAIDVGRARSRRALPTDTIVEPAASTAHAEPDSSLTSALAALPDKQRRCVAYHYLAGLPYAEVALILGGTEAAARRAASRRDRDTPTHYRTDHTMNSELDITATLQRAVPADTDHLRRLHERLATAADADHLVDVAYRTIDTPVGRLLLAATETGLVRVAYASEDHDRVLQALSDRISPRVLHHPRRLDDAAHELDEYFCGGRHTFDLHLDWRLSTGFRATVLQHLRDIAYGHTASYASVAQLAGRPKAVRAVGTACATNPLPVVVPCHRVVRSDGSMGGYLGGVAAKATLLELEARS